MNIRLANLNDTRTLLNIYKKYINTLITFEYELPTEKEFATRIQTFSKTYPYLVLEDNSKILGYAYAHRYQERAAYSWNAELSIYLDDTITHKGYGKKLYSTLLDILKLQGLRNVYALITETNETSKKLQQSFNFTKTGVYHNTGYKNGRWLNVEIWEKQLNPYNLNPKNIISIQDLDKNELNQILKRYCSEDQRLFLH